MNDVGSLEARGEHGNLRGAVHLDDQDRQVAEMTFAIGPFVAAGPSWIEMSARGAAQHEVSLLPRRTTIRLFMNVSAVRARGQIAQIGHDEKTVRNVSKADRTDFLGPSQQAPFSKAFIPP